MRFVERKAQKGGWLLRQGPLWANSPVVSPVRLEVGREGPGGAREGREQRGGGPEGGSAAARGAVCAGTVDGMDTSWWPALAAVVLLALVATLVDGWGRRGRRPAARTRSAPRPEPEPAGDRSVRAEERPRPRPAEIWRARVPHEDGTDGPEGGDGDDRPCLVLSVRGDRVRIARISTKFREERAGVIPLPPGSVGEARGRTSFLVTDEPRDVPVRDFRHRVGVADPLVWDQVRHLAG